MARLLLFVVIGVLAWLLYRTIVGVGRKKGGSPPAAKTEDMVACSLCGVNLPKSEAQLIDGAYRCPQGESCVHRTKD